MTDLFTSSKTAVISECGAYRYRLDRRIGAPGPTVAFFGVNPSTADADAEDATTRKWNGFCDRNGFGRYIVGNVFAFRATDVRALGRGNVKAIGIENYRKYVPEIIEAADILIPCWGDRAKIPKYWRDVPATLLGILRMSGKPIRTFGFTKGGDPKHPLMLGYDTPITDWIPK